MFTFRGKYLFLTIVLFAVELYIALYMHDSIIRPYGGDFLVVIFLYCALRTFLDKPVMNVAVSTLLFSYFIEITQYYHLIYKLGWENSLMAHLILGSTYKWLDMVAYTLGFLLIIFCEQLNVGRWQRREIVLKTP